MLTRKGLQNLAQNIIKSGSKDLFVNTVGKARGVVVPSSCLLLPSYHHESMQYRDLRLYNKTALIHLGSLFPTQISIASFTALEISPLGTNPTPTKIHGLSQRDCSRFR